MPNTLPEKTHFNLTVLFADNDGAIAFVDVSGIEQALDRLGDSIALRMIVVNYNHYEPLFTLDDIDHLALRVESLGLEESSPSLGLPSYVVNMPMKVDSDEEGEASSDEEVDQTFPQAAFQRPCDYYRLLPASEGEGKEKKKMV